MAPLKATPPDGFVPMADAVERFGVSARTIVRRIEAGQIEGEQIARPQGTVWYVRLPAEAAEDAAPDAAQGGNAESDQGTMSGGEQTALAAALVWTQGQVEALTERNERQAATIIEQAQRVGQLEGTLAAERARADAAEAERDRLRGRRWWTWWG
jgi:hypothetical protein